MNYKSVINWVKKSAKQIQKIIKDNHVSQNVEILELDEMCTILKKNQTSCGFGQQLNEKQKK